MSFYAGLYWGINPPPGFGTAEPPPAVEGEYGLERFRLPDWFARGGDNAAVLQTLWDGVYGLRPNQAAAMARPNTAAGRWLDLWGDIAGVRRLSLETDTLYRARILTAMGGERLTCAAIQAALTAAFPGSSVIVWDWRTVPVYEAPIVLYDGSKTYDGSVTYGGGNFLGLYPTLFNRFVVDFQGTQVDVTRARALIETLRAAGNTYTIRHGTPGNWTTLYNPPPP